MTSHRRLSELLAGKIAIRIPLWVLLLLPLTAYFLWEAWWYYRVGLGFIKWHTHLMLFAYLWPAGVLVIRIAVRTEEAFQKCFLVFSAVVFALFLAEIFLELSEVNKTYLEKISGQYSTPYAPNHKGKYHAWSTYEDEHWIKKREYQHWRPTNSLGIGHREWEVTRKPGEVRLLALGDSFTEGDGAPYDSSYVAILEHLLKESHYHVYVMNGGVCGSDPFYNFIHLKDKMIPYKPDLVIQNISAQDLTTDVIIRGGFERFQEDGTVRFSKGPWWEPLYAISYISRLYFNKAGYNELLRKADISKDEEETLKRQATELFGVYSEYCKEKNIKLVVVLRPDKTEWLNNHYEFDFTDILNYLKTLDQVYVIDLLPEYSSYIAERGTGIDDYFWKNDGHHNPKGYEMMAITIYKNLLPVLNELVIGIQQPIAKDTARSVGQ